MRRGDMPRSEPVPEAVGGRFCPTRPVFRRLPPHLSAIPTRLPSLQMVLVVVQGASTGFPQYFVEDPQTPKYFATLTVFCNVTDGCGSLGTEPWNLGSTLPLGQSACEGLGIQFG